ncbi:MAG: hypothetical protein ACTSVY_04325, partial [Candidatus Helarchaeota archaeon]
MDNSDEINDENADQETEEEIEEENPTILDVLMGYKHDADKIIVLGKSLETILNYIEKLEVTNAHTSNYLEYMYNQMSEFMATINTATLSQQFQIIHNRIDDIENRFEKLVEIQMNISKTQPLTNPSGAISSDVEQRIVGELSGIRTKITDLEEKISGFQSQLTQIQSSGMTASRRAPSAPSLDGYRPGPPKTPQGQVVEENLLKPSSFGGGGAPVSSGGGGAPMGGMSIRMAMMNEIRARMSKRSGAEVPRSSGSGDGGGDKGFALPRIQQPRQAKPLSGGIVGKMNKLLDAKFKQTAPAGSGGIKIGNKTGAGPPKGPPKGSPRGPPRGPPSGKNQD